MEQREESLSPSYICNEQTQLSLHSYIDLKDKPNISLLPIISVQ